MRTVRFLEIEKLTETRRIFANAEVFAGLLGDRAVRPSAERRGGASPSWARR